VRHITTTTPASEGLRSCLAPLIQHYRCSADLPPFRVAPTLKKTNGFFRFGSDVLCYGHSLTHGSATPAGSLEDVSLNLARNGHGPMLPFDPAEVVDNLRFEHYVASPNRLVDSRWIKDLYYRLRPMFPVAFRKHLQKIYLRDWDRIVFPAWPLDRTVDRMLEKLLVLVMKEMNVERLPFIWFWPDGYSSCIVMTHDVETAAGRDFCEAVMDIDDEFGVKGSFQIVPEKRYAVPSSYLETIRQREFEVNIQGLDHDGNLFENREAFLEKAAKIKKYAAEYQARGFRSPILYRNAEWMQYLDFSYDMSIPNVARLEAQRGGCCTLMPYTLPGGTTELPVTMIEDYTLFHILKDFSIELWKRQMKMAIDGNGLMNFIIHPDYVESDRTQRLFRELLQEIDLVRSTRNVWVSLPREVDLWWRERSAMKLVLKGNRWAVEGVGSDRARIAHARYDGERLMYELEPGGER
jgi:hypothetical protein